MKRLLLLILVLLFLSPLVARGAQEEIPPGVTAITWWHPNSGLAGKATDTLIRRFNEGIGKEQGIHVTGVYQGKANDVLTKAKAIMQSSSTRDLPDLLQLDGAAVLDVREHHSIIPMEQLAVSDGFDLAQILEAARLSITYQNQMIAMPFNSSTILLYYNKSAFEEAGIKSAPRTLDELRQVAMRLVEQDSRGKVTRHGVANVPTTYELICWLGQQHGLSYITDEENGHTGTPTRVLFDENGTMVAFLTKWKALYESGALANLTGDLNSTFASGKVTMIFASTSNLTTIEQMVGDRFELGVAPLPMVDEAATGGVNVGGGALWAVDNESGNEKAAWEFVKFLTAKEQQLFWHIETGYFPVHRDTYQMQGFQEHLLQHPRSGVAIDQLLESNPQLQGIWVPSGYQIYYAFQSGILRMLEEGLSPEETSAALAKEIDGYLEEFIRMQR
ncbi:MAG TPA: ABC transporter substrate-binding protein [Sphaerochaeta sp.]|nr:ABC transporter substrate-binding protein [Sphaerochaeta sp.]